MRTRSNTAAFTLIEIVVVVLILAILAGAMIPRVTNRMAEARDARRMAGMKSIVDALDKYFTEKRVYPAAETNSRFGGYDVSQDGDFIPELVKGGYLKETAKDPINDDVYHYAYRLYAKDANGCIGEGSYYVLGMTKFETDDFATKNPCTFKCSRKDWSQEFAYAVAGGVVSSKSK